jgi:hypothetical protein
MKKNDQLYTEAHGLQLAYASDFSSFVAIRGRFYGNLKPGSQWIEMPSIPGTLMNGSTSDGNTPPMYTLNIKFRVSYDELENQQEIEAWAAAPVIARFTNGSGQGVIYGSKMYPLRLRYTKPEGFEGFECEIKGLSDTAQTYV